MRSFFSRTHATTMDRCRNCGLLWHAAASCPNWGPVHPAPGRTVRDYRPVITMIKGKVARDEEAKFGDLDNDSEWGGKPAGARRTTIGQLRLSIGCGQCEMPAGSVCVDKYGEPTPHFHRPRIAAARRILAMTEDVSEENEA